MGPGDAHRFLPRTRGRQRPGDPRPLRSVLWGWSTPQHRVPSRRARQGAPGTPRGYRIAGGRAADPHWASRTWETAIRYQIFGFTAISLSLAKPRPALSSNVRPVQGWCNGLKSYGLYLIPNAREAFI